MSNEAKLTKDGLTSDGSMITILLADDDPDDRQLTRDAFTENRLANALATRGRRRGAAGLPASPGQYEELQNTPLPGLILLDLNMPRKDGREALKEIKADPEFRRIPIVVLTTSKAEEDILRTLRPGREFLHHQTGDVQVAGGNCQSPRPILV